MKTAGSLNSSRRKTFVALAHAFFALASWPSFGAQAAEASAPCIASTISIDLGLGWKTPTASSSNDVIPPSAQLIVAANRLPYVVSEKGGNLVSANAGGGLVSALNSTQARFDWIGWPGSSFEAHRHASARRFIAKIDRKLRLSPIFLSQEEKNLFYNEYANRVLWPGFHGFEQVAPSTPETWNAFKSVNSKFAQSLVERLEAAAQRQPDGPLLAWIHDYQLALVPAELRKLIQDKSWADRVKIGFFLHIPFPSPSEMSRIPKPERDAILHGILGSDEVAFHTREYRDLFQSSVQQELHLSGDNGSIQHGNRLVRIREHPIGINPDHFRQVLAAPEAQKLLQSLRKKYSGYKVLLGVERLDPIKGIPEKLAAYERYLESHPEAIGKTVLIQVAQPSRMDIEEYITLHKEIHAIAKRINERFTKPGRLPPIELNDQGFNTTELVSHLRLADATLITSLKDGMNLVAFEAAAILHAGKDTHGALVLSNETGASKWLKGAIQVNPKSINSIAQAIHSALTLSAEEKRAAAAYNAEHVDRMTSGRWVYDSLHSLAGLEH